MNLLPLVEKLNAWKQAYPGHDCHIVVSLGAYQQIMRQYRGGWKGALKPLEGIEIIPSRTQLMASATIKEGEFISGSPCAECGEHKVIPITNRPGNWECLFCGYQWIYNKR